jgi:CDP-6-deoxy-D-xylo-4-hexulose-3-dehydrase
MIQPKAKAGDLKFVDVDLHTLNFDLDQLKLAVSDNTKMILAVNLLGNPNNFDAIKEIIGSRDIILMAKILLYRLALRLLC